MLRLLKFVAVLLPILFVAFFVDCVVHIYGGPASSGALALTRATGAVPKDHDLPQDYVPSHRGGIDLQTGLYTRTDEDLVVHGPAPIVLRRTYRTNDSRSRAFGVGSSHDGEWFLVGDRDRFQWVAMILADGGRVNFDRVSSGTSYGNAMFEHRSSPTEFLGARLGWTGLGWAMLLRNGSLLQFEGCGPPKPRPCGLVQTRDVDGHVYQQTRDADGRLLKIAVGQQWIAFDYDANYRVSSASDSAGDSVTYAYDWAGRLVLVKDRDGTERRYTYTDHDEMQTIVEPGIAIENTYLADRCVRQVTRLPDDAKPYVFDFSYRAKADRVIEGDITESDGTWTKDGFDENGYTVSQVFGHGATIDSRVTFEREAPSKVVKSITVSCRDRTGRMSDHSRAASPGQEEWTVRDMLMINCGWDRRTQVR